MKKPAAAPAATGNDNWILYLAVIAFSIIFGLLLAWGYYYQTRGQGAGPEQAYAKMNTVRFQIQDFSVRTQMTLQSGQDSGAWIGQNKSQLQKFLETRLQDTAPAQLTSTKPDKIPTLQADLTAALNSEFPQAKVDQVLITEFLMAHEQQ
jgi:hypothetical protein